MRRDGGGSRGEEVPGSVPGSSRSGRSRAPLAGLARSRRARRIRWVRRGLGIGTLALVLGLILPVSWIAHRVYLYDRDLPPIEPFIRFELPTTGRVYDARGAVLITLAHEYRTVVSYHDVPPILRAAILAAEDKNFFSHAGVDYSVLPRVAQKTLARSLGTPGDGEDTPMSLRLPQGGSTLTQQLVRGYFLQDRTDREDAADHFRRGFGPQLLATVLGVPRTNKLLRKLEEVRLSLWLEREMESRFGSRTRAKQEIFARYASFIYMGNGRYGFEAASEYYFDKPLAAYTMADAGQAALLAGVGKSPSAYAPVEGDPRPLRRRNEILVLMARLGYISEVAAARAEAEPVRVAAPSTVKTIAPAAIESVFSELKLHGGDRFGVDDLIRGRVWIQTTVDERVQLVVNDALESGLAAYEARHPRAAGRVQGSVVVLRNHDAAILAEVGGRRLFNDRLNAYYDYNRASDSMRQPGSAWKPLVYLAGFRAGMDLDSIVQDEPISVPNGTGRDPRWITNYDGRFKGAMPVRQALAESRNTVAIRIATDVGVDWMIQTARELGIRSEINRYLSTALGASEVRLLELANVYRGMASGVVATPHVIAHVTDAAGTVLYQAPEPRGRLRAEGLRQIQEGLRGVVRIPGGTANALDRRDFPIPVMGKTGTTSGFRDALFVGSTFGPEGITVAVRIGFDDNGSLGSEETGARTALPIFRDIMLHVYQAGFAGPVPTFPREIEASIDRYIASTMEPGPAPTRVGGSGRRR